MSAHSQESGELFNDFFARLRSAATRDSFTVTKVYGQAQLLRIDGPRKATLNVRTDSQNYGWWGFTKNVEADLERAGVKWFLVLLGAVAGEGYLLSDVEVYSAKIRWNDAGQQYHIHLYHLQDRWRFRGIEHFWGRIKARI